MNKPEDDQDATASASLKVDANSRGNGSNKSWRWQGITIFATLVFGCFLVAMSCCADGLRSPEWITTTLIQILLISVVFGWYAFATLENQAIFFFRFALVSLCTVVILMVLTKQAFLFWLCLAYAAGITCIKVMSETKVKRRQDGVLMGIYTALIVVSAIIYGGSIKEFQYAKPALDLRAVNIMFDIRYCLGCILAIGLIGNSLFEAFEEKPPIVPNLPWVNHVFNPIDGKSMFSAIFKEFFRFGVLLINFIIDHTHRIVNAFWKLIAFIFVYSRRAVENFVSRLWGLVTEKVVIIWVLRITLSFVMLVVLAYTLESEPSKIESYLRSNDLILAAHTMGMLLIPQFLLAYMFIHGFCWLWSVRNNYYLQAAHAATVIVVGFSVTGWLMWLLGKCIPPAEIVGFKK